MTSVTRKEMLEDGITPSVPTMFCMTITPMKQDGTIDEAGYRAHLRRMVDAGVGVYLGSGGSGQGHALDPEELGFVYKVGVSECKGKIPVYCNPPEARTAKEMLWKCKLAVEAGIEVVQLYQLDPGHGHHPTQSEQEQYFRDVLDQLSHPVALSIHRGAAGYAAPANLVARLCSDYPQIVAINLLRVELDYFVRLQDSIPKRIKLYGGFASLLSTLALGGWGCLAREPNLYPKLCRSIVAHFLAGRQQEMGDAYKQVIRLWDAMAPAWVESTEVTKAVMRTLGLPGGHPRAPVAEATLQRIRRRLEELNVRELEGLPPANPAIGV